MLKTDPTISHLTSKEFISFIKESKYIPNFNRKQQLVDKIVVTTHCILPKEIKQLPDLPIIFKEGLDARFSTISHFDSEVFKSCFFGDSLKTIGHNAKFHKSIHCEFISGMQVFNNYVNKNAHFLYSSLKEIGPNAKFNGNLDCSHTKLTSFNSQVKGTCNFTGTPLKEIGPNANFGNNLNLSGTNINPRKTKLQVEGSLFLDSKYRNVRFKRGSFVGQHIFIGSQLVDKQKYLLESITRSDGISDIAMDL